MVVGTAILVVRARDRRFRSTLRELGEVKRRLHQGLAVPGISIFAVGRKGTITWFAGRPVPGTTLSLATASGAEMVQLFREWPD
ncbi:MAG: hypothetical protein O3A10_07255 [Chloroflexi bacterium]|nr:hypothetical protein [Chloroflexota bacterium]MDA1146100.1 hypothetical protein [Chloroflexota bacterium]